MGNARPALGTFFEKHPLLWHGISTLLRTTWGDANINGNEMSPPFLERVVDLIKDNLSFSMEEQTIFYGSYAVFAVLTLLLSWMNYHEMQMPLKFFLKFKEGRNSERLRECKSALFSLHLIMINWSLNQMLKKVVVVLLCKHIDAISILW